MCRALIKTILAKAGYQLTRTDHPPTNRNAYRDIEFQLRNTKELSIFDVGAYTGEVTLNFRRLFPAANIYSFEANPNVFQELQKNIANDKRTRAFNCAVSEKCGTVTLHRNENAATNSLLRFTNNETHQQSWSSFTSFEQLDSIQIASKSIDKICDEMKLSRINLLKLDVQGAELQVLNGATEMLNRKRIDFVYSELLLTPCYKDQPTAAEALSNYANFGLRLFNIYNILSDQKGQALQCDALFAAT